MILDFGDFGFWGFEILDFGDFGFWGVWILDFGAGIPNPKSKIQNPQSKLFWPNFLDFGFWIWDRYVAILYVRPQRPIFWILAGILDFGSWGYRILDFGDFGIWGFWIVDFGDFGFWGFRILDFGLGILDGDLVTKFWMLHKKRRLCTPNRVGGLVILVTSDMMLIDLDISVLYIGFCEKFKRELDATPPT